MTAWLDTTHLPEAAFALPREPTPALMQLLRIPPAELHQVGRVLERAGFSVPRHDGDSWARALFFLLPYAIAFGDDWWRRAQEQLVLIDPAQPTTDKDSAT